MEYHDTPHGGTGNYQNISDAIAWLRLIDPRRVLDVGCGFGRWGFLCREFLDIWNGRWSRRDWAVHLIGVDAFPGNITEHHHLIYDEVYPQPIEDFFAQSKDTFDLIILGDVLEHFPKTLGYQVLDESLDRGAYVMLVLPLGGDWPQPALYENRYEQHLSVWYEENILKYTPLVVCTYRDYLDRPFLGAILSRQDPKGIASQVAKVTPSKIFTPVRITPEDRRAASKAVVDIAEISSKKIWSEKKLHLALISMEYPPFFGGGIGTYAYHLCRLLGEAGHRVSVFSLTHEGDVPDLPNVTVHLLPNDPPAPTGLVELDWLAENLRRGQWISEQANNIHSQQPIDVIEITDYYMDGLSLDTSFLTCQEGGSVPLVTHFHGPNSLVTTLDGSAHPLLNQLEEIIFTESPFRKTYSPKMRDQVNQLWPGADCQFIPAPFFSPKIDRDSAFTESDQAFEFDLLYFGRMERRKGVEKFAQALKILTAEGVLPRVCFVGGDTSTSPTGKSMAEWLERELRPPLGAKLHLRERMPQEKLWAFLPRARVLVIPSLWESLGYVILEAACSGRPVIFSQEAGVAYMLKGTLKERSLVDVRDPKTFAAKLRQVLDMPEEELVTWGRQLNEAVQKEFHPDRVLKHTVQYYQSCMEAAATAKAPGGAHQREFLLSYTKKFIDMAQGRNDDYIRLWNENQKLWNENQQIWNENQKLWNEHQKLGNEHQKLGSEHQKLGNEHQQLGNYHQQLGNEHQQLVNEHQQLLMWQRAITSSLTWRISRRLRHSPLGELAALISQRLGRQ